MAEKKTTPIVIDDVEYQYEDMTQEQQVLVNHVADLDRKIGSTQFNLDQLTVGKQAFVQLLKQALEAKPEEVLAETTTE
jgi:cell division septum initiation protein DivIVA